MAVIRHAKYGKEYDIQKQGVHTTYKNTNIESRFKNDEKMSGEVRTRIKGRARMSNWEEGFGHP